MALRIGDVSFGVQANTRGIQKAAQQLRAFERVTSIAARGTDKVTSAVKRQDAALRENTRRVHGLSQTLRNLESASVLAIGPLSGLGARIRSLGAIATRSNFAIGALLGGIAAATVGFFKLGQAGLVASRVFEEANARFLAASGSVETAGKQMDFVIRTARSLGLRIDASAKAFSRLTAATRGTAIEGAGTRKIFLAVSKAAAALHLEAGEVTGTFRAIEQIMSKGTVQAEELRGQLGERLPGAFRIAAEAMGVTTRELGDMLKTGEVMSDEFLPKFARALEQAFGATATDNVNSLTGATNELANAWLLFSQKFDEVAGVSNKVIRLLQLTTDALDSVRTASVDVGFSFDAISEAAIRSGGPLAAFVRLLMLIRDGEEKIVEEAKKVRTNFDMTPILSGKGMSAGFKQFKKSTRDAITEFNILRRTIAEAQRGTNIDPDKLFPFFQAIEQLSTRTQAELELVAKEIGEALGRPVTAKITDIAFAMGELSLQTGKLEEEFKKLQKAFKPENLDAFNRLMERSGAAIEIMRQRLEALNQGQEAVDLFDRISGKVLELERRFIAAGGHAKDFKDRLEELRAVLEATAAAEDKLKIDKAIERANEQLDIMKKRLDALRAGDAAIEYFNTVTLKLDAFKRMLKAANIPLAEQIRLIREYKKLLEESLQEEKLKAIADQFSNAITNSLEDIILKTKETKEAFKELGREIARVIIRALILDPLKKALGGAIQGLLGGLGGFGGGGGATPPPTFGGTFAHGGGFKVGGRGGPDSQLVSFRATPGEEVRIAPRSRGSSGMGGSVTIVQHIDARGATDPGVIRRATRESQIQTIGIIHDLMRRNKIGK